MNTTDARDTRPYGERQLESEKALLATIDRHIALWQAKRAVLRWWEFLSRRAIDRDLRTFRKWQARQLGRIIDMQAERLDYAVKDAAFAEKTLGFKP